MLHSEFDVSLDYIRLYRKEGRNIRREEGKDAEEREEWKGGGGKMEGREELREGGRNIGMVAHICNLSSWKAEPEAEKLTVSLTT